MTSGRAGALASGAEHGAGAIDDGARAAAPSASTGVRGAAAIPGGARAGARSATALRQAGARALRRGVDLRRYPRLLARHPEVAPHARDGRWLADFAADHADFLVDLGRALCDDDDC